MKFLHVPEGVISKAATVVKMQIDADRKTKKYKSIYVVFFSFKEFYIFILKENNFIKKDII